MRHPFLVAILIPSARHSLTYVAILVNLRVSASELTHSLLQLEMKEYPVA